MKKISLMLAGAVFSALSAAEYCAPVQKKIINIGWNTQFKTPYLKAHVAELEAATPCQGTALCVQVRNRDGKLLHTSDHLCGKIRWEYADFAPALKDLRETKFRKFTDNFLGTAIRSGNVDWFSDSDWSAVCNNYGLAARFAREAGLKGIILDLEEYSEKLWNPFREKKHSRAELFAKVRQRGAEFGKAIFTEFPNIRILAFFWLSLARNYYLTPQEAHSLIPPFLNGIYDVMPPAATIIEGHESHGYTARNPEQIYHLRVDFTSIFPRLLAPENLKKFRLQTQLAVPFYMDPYFRRTGKLNTWGKALSPDIEEMGQLELFKQNLRAALETSDEYVWFWSERVSWYPMEKFHPLRGALLLEPAFPGLTGWTELMQDPENYAKRPGALGPDLARNGDFARGDAGGIAHWSTWQDSDSKGKISFAPGCGPEGKNAVLLEGVTNGCLEETIKVKPGQIFLVSGWAKTEGGARAKLFVNWQDKTQNWCWRGYYTVKMFPAEKNTWQYQQMVVTAPKDAVTLTLLPGSLAADPKGKVYFYGFKVREIRPAGIDKKVKK